MSDGSVVLELSQANFALADKINTDALSKICTRSAPRASEQDLSEFDQVHPQVSVLIFCCCVRYKT